MSNHTETGPFPDLDCVRCTNNQGTLLVEIWGAEMFNHGQTEAFHRLCCWIEQSTHPCVTLDLRQVTYFCTTALGRLAQCIAALQRNNRDLRLQVKGYSQKALMAIGFDHVVPMECVP